jgi:hypothetical protein
MTMDNPNNALHDVVVSDKAFLFTKRHLKHLFPTTKYFDEDSTYFFVSPEKNYIYVIEVNGNQCNEYENMNTITINNLIMQGSDSFKHWSKATKMLIIRTIWTKTQKTDMSIYWTNAEILRNTKDISEYFRRIHVTVDGAFFKAFTSWLKKSVPGLVIVTDTVII